MKTIIAGGRSYRFTAEDIKILNQLTITEVVSGGSKGADADGEAYALTHKLPVKIFPADWKRYGPAAGPIRNKSMAAYADAVVLFPGGKGTDSMYRQANIAGLLIFDYREIA